MLKILPKPPERPRTDLPRPGCYACRHPQRLAIDLDLVAGEPLRRVGERFGLSHSCVSRHKLECVPENLLQARNSKVVAEADYVLARLIELDSKLRRIVELALGAADTRTAIAASGELRRLLELQASICARSSAVTSRRPETPDLDHLKKELLNALADHPAARAALSAALVA